MGTSPWGKKPIPLLDESASEMKVIDFQTTSLISDELISAESVSGFLVACSDEYSMIKKLCADNVPLPLYM